MSVNRFFLDPQAIDVSGGRVLINQSGLIKQIKHVLRKKIGDEVIVLDGLGKLYRCALSKLESNQIEVRIISQETIDTEPAVKVTIALPILRGGRFEWALQKMTELGVSAITPVITERSTIRDFGPKKIEHWRNILKEASEQCERSIAPSIIQPQLLPDLLRKATLDFQITLVGAERRSDQALHEYLLDCHRGQQQLQKVFVLVGPEGGFGASELEQILSFGLKPVSLGKRLLRTETAAIYALSQIISFFE